MKQSTNSVGFLERLLFAHLRQRDDKADPVDSQLPEAQVSVTPVGARSFVKAGAGTPTVVFESGLGEGKEAWASVFNEVAAETQAFAYDRAGYGQSERSALPRDGQQIVNELRALLVTENIPPPYVLVGHSLGGTLVKLFARMYPAEVAGVILVDARHAEFAEKCRQKGVSRLLYEPPMALFMMARAAIRDELSSVSATAAQTAEAGPFPPVPLIVITHPQWTTGWPREISRAWAASQRSMVQMSALGKMKVCRDSGHHVHKDRPEVVVRAILNVVAAARYTMARRAAKELVGRNKPSLDWLLEGFEPPQDQDKHAA